MKRLKACLKCNRPKDLNADASIALKENLQMQHPFIFFPNDSSRALPESLTILVAQCHVIYRFLSEHLATSNRDWRGMGMFLSSSYDSVPRSKTHWKFAWKAILTRDCISSIAKERLRLTGNSIRKAKPKTDMVISIATLLKQRYHKGLCR